MGSCLYDEIFHRKKLEESKGLISEPNTDENGNLIRMVNGKKIIQIPETSEEAIRKNEIINNWRLRNK